MKIRKKWSNNPLLVKRSTGTFVCMPPKSIWMRLHVLRSQPEKVREHWLFTVMKADEICGNRSADPQEVRGYTVLRQNFHHFDGELE